MNQHNHSPHTRTGRLFLEKSLSIKFPHFFQNVFVSPFNSPNTPKKNFEGLPKTMSCLRDKIGQLPMRNVGVRASSMPNASERVRCISGQHKIRWKSLISLVFYAVAGARLRLVFELVLEVRRTQRSTKWTSTITRHIQDQDEFFWKKVCQSNFLTFSKMFSSRPSCWQS